MSPRSTHPTAGGRIAFLGSSALWDQPKLAFFCSAKCPGEILLRVLKWVPTLADRNDIVLASGFHTPVEREVLRLALRQQTPVIICPARGLPKIVPLAWRDPLAEGRLLIATPFPASVTSVELNTPPGNLPACR